MSTYIRKQIEARDDASKNELVRFAKHNFKPNGDKRVWPRFLAKEYSAARDRLKVSKRRLRIGRGSKASVEGNERDLAEIIAHAKEYWLGARQSFPAAKLKRLAPGPRKRPKPLIANPLWGPRGPGDGTAKIDRTSGIGGIALRTRQLERLDLSCSSLGHQVRELVALDIQLLNGRPSAIASAPGAHWDEPEITDGPEANSHVLLWKRSRQRVRQRAQCVHQRSTKQNSADRRGSVQIRRISAAEQRAISEEFAEECRREEEDYAVRVERDAPEFMRFLALKSETHESEKRVLPQREDFEDGQTKPEQSKITEDRLCSAVNPSAARVFRQAEDATERIGFLFYYNPNRRRI